MLNRGKGLLFIMSAPAGTGKTTLAKLLIRKCSRVEQSISCTTRAPRTGEIEGIHYQFLTPEEFAAKRQAGEFLECATIYGDEYGTEKRWVEEKRKEGFHVLLVIDTQGTAQVKKLCPDAITIFLLPPSLEELERRLKHRATETDQRLETRLKRAKEEIEAAANYDYTLVNDDLEQSSEILKCIIIAEEYKVRRYA